MLGAGLMARKSEDNSTSAAVAVVDGRWPGFHVEFGPMVESLASRSLSWVLTESDRRALFHCLPHLVRCRQRLLTGHWAKYSHSLPKYIYLRGSQMIWSSWQKWSLNYACVHCFLKISLFLRSIFSNFCFYVIKSCAVNRCKMAIVCMFVFMQTIYILGHIPMETNFCYKQMGLNEMKQFGCLA